jgi:hypothetical protein
MLAKALWLAWVRMVAQVWVLGLLMLVLRLLLRFPHLHLPPLVLTQRLLLLQISRLSQQQVMQVVI